MTANILIVDDEQNTRQGLKTLLAPKGYDILLAENGEEAIEIVKKEGPEIILVDLRLPGMDGLEVLKKVKKITPQTIVILLTAYGTVENAVQAMREGAYHYLTKPINSDELEHILEQALRRHKLERENIELRKELNEKYESEKIIGKSKQIRELLELVKRVASSNTSVLIEGESGTGKELLAHLIHGLSPRKDKPFVVVHCASLTETLLASELFGHERGAFTGASERRIGRFERAHSGTIFLDEVGEIKENMQVKLLRVLQEGEFERVGGNKTLRADVRLICATNKNLTEEVKKGNFREDLFYRINVIMLKVPPLRERKEDIPLLIRHFVDYYGRINNKIITKIEPQALDALSKYHWPGNVRELKNVIERMVVLTQTKNLAIENVPADIATPVFPGQQVTEFSKNMALKDVEKELIQQKLKEVKGNKTLAAKNLGISRRTIYRKLKEYGLEYNKAFNKKP